MKRTIAILLFLMSCMLYAETGYRGHEWGTTEFLFEIEAGESDTTIGWEGLPFEAKIYKTKLLGEERELYYVFSQEYFCTAFYIIPADITDKLINNFDIKNRLAYIPTEQMEFDYNEAVKEYLYDEDEITAKRKVDFLTGIQCLYVCFKIENEADLTKAQNQEAENQLIIYNYNSDTRVYIYKNIYAGKTVVVYYPHEQDY